MIFWYSSHKALAIHNGLRVYLYVLKVKPVSRVPNNLGCYCPLVHLRWAQDVQHVFEEEEEVTRNVTAFLDPSFAQSPDISCKGEFPKHVDHSFRVLVAKLTVCPHDHPSST
nr:hypothetical protein CFP56_51763 [Quercus suber]